MWCPLGPSESPEQSAASELYLCVCVRACVRVCVCECDIHVSIYISISTVGNEKHSSANPRRNLTEML